jgi:hypothetical protein
VETNDALKQPTIIMNAVEAMNQSKKEAYTNEDCNLPRTNDRMA